MDAPFPVRFAAAFALMLLPVATACAQSTRITPALMARHVSVLAHDSMLGRATPSPQLELAAAYIEAAFRRAGLRPAGETGGFVQRYPLPGGTGPNVIGLLPGRDSALARQYVAVIAHFDHTGVGRPTGGDSIRNGADDNASGTAGLLAIAEAFAAGARTRRSLLFIAVSGEERDLLGSRWYAEHPTVPLENIVGLINLDMIGRNRPDSVYLNGWAKSTISDLVQRLAAEHRELGLAVAPDEEDRAVTPADSDHWPFQHRGIPYIFFYTGAHPDYHRVGDEPSRVNADKAARVARLAFYTAEAIANDPTPPAWEPESRRLNVPPRP